MAVRLVLLCAGGTASARTGGFPDPTEPLDAGGRAKACALRLEGLPPAECMVGPARSARATADLLGFDAEPMAALRDIDRGDWTGRRFDSIGHDALVAWLAAPETATPGGESMGGVVDRVAPWLDGLRGGDRRILAITHAAVIRAALAHALAIPIAATLAVDVAPLSAASLSFHDRWRLQELRRG